MDFDTLRHWLSMPPLIVFLLACALLVLAVLAGWYAGRHHGKRGQETKVVRVPTVVEDAASRSDQVAASEERQRAERRLPREWDGGQPRPNWNRRSG